jgi:hypothetical protein
MRFVRRCLGSLLVLALSLWLPALAGTGPFEPTHPAHVHATPAGAHAFFIEFRARHEQAGFGHAYMVLGAHDAAGHRIETARFGFIPSDEDDQRWSQLALPVNGLVGVSRSDFSAAPDVRFRVALRRSAYHTVIRDLEQYRAEWTTYALLGHNCNDLVAAVARSIGLDAPLLTVQLPPSYVAELKLLNAPH